MTAILILAFAWQMSAYRGLPNVLLVLLALVLLLMLLALNLALANLGVVVNWFNNLMNRLLTSMNVLLKLKMLICKFLQII